MVDLGRGRPGKFDGLSACADGVRIVVLNYINP